MTWSFFGNRARNEGKPRRNKRSHRKPFPGKRRPRFETLEDRSLLAVLTVNSLLDNTTAGDGLVTLREAVLAADGNSATDLGAVGSGVDTIQFAPGLTGTITLGGTELDVTESVIINGPGAANLAINANGLSRIFNFLNTTGDNTVKGLTLTNGNAGGSSGGAIRTLGLGLLTVADSVITGSTADSGGGIYSFRDVNVINSTIGTATAPNQATVGDGGGIAAHYNVTLKNSTVSSNLAMAGGGGVASARSVTLENSTINNNAATAGGGIFAADVVNLFNSQITGNSSATGGGGIYAQGNVSVRFSTISGNSTGVKGGGIFSSGTTVTIENSTIGGPTIGFGNVVGGMGGGIYASHLTATNSTIASNEARNDGAKQGIGGGIFANGMTLRNCTIASNQAAVQGGGLQGNDVTILSSTIANNNSNSDNDATGAGGGIAAFGSLVLSNSIVIGNTGLFFPDVLIGGAASRLVQASLIGNNTGLPAGFSATGPLNPDAFGNLIGAPSGPNAIPIAQVLDPAGLKNNGGPTATIALLAGSLAINKGKNTLVVSANTGDQRGLPFVRIFGGTVDMGAYEFQTIAANSPPVVKKSIPGQKATVGCPFKFSFDALTFFDANRDVLTYTATLASGAPLPAWLSFTQGTGGRSFVGIPGPGDVRPITIRVTASDGKGGLASTDFVLNVIPALPPTPPCPPAPAKPLPDQTTMARCLYAYTLPNQLFWGLGVVPLTYSASLANGGALPSWLKFNPATHTFIGTPTAANVGALSIRVTVTTSTGASASANFTLTLKPYLWNWPTTPTLPTPRR